MLGNGPDASPHAAVFRANVWLVLFLPPLMVMIGLAIVWPLFTVLSGLDFTWSDLGSNAAGGGIGMLAANSVIAWRKGWYWSRLCVSFIGIEIGARHRGVLISWDDIVSARVRRPGPLAILEIVPRDLHALRVDLPSRDLPRIRYPGGQPVLTIDVGCLCPGPNELRAELRRHLQ